MGSGGVERRGGRVVGGGWCGGGRSSGSGRGGSREAAAAWRLLLLLLQTLLVGLGLDPGSWSRPGPPGIADIILVRAACHSSHYNSTEFFKLSDQIFLM